MDEPSTRDAAMATLVLFYKMNTTAYRICLLEGRNLPYNRAMLKGEGEMRKCFTTAGVVMVIAAVRIASAGIRLFPAPVLFHA